MHDNIFYHAYQVHPSYHVSFNQPLISLPTRVFPEEENTAYCVKLTERGTGQSRLEIHVALWQPLQNS